MEAILRCPKKSAFLRNLHSCGPSPQGCWSLKTVQLRIAAEHTHTHTCSCCHQPDAPHACMHKRMITQLEIQVDGPHVALVYNGRTLLVSEVSSVPPTVYWQAFASPSVLSRLSGLGPRFDRIHKLSAEFSFWREGVTQSCATSSCPNHPNILNYAPFYQGELTYFLSASLQECH